jgi:hypothetical protein
MKILQIMAGAGRGGAETAFVDITTALHEAGETIEIVTRANDIRVPALRAAGIIVHTLPFGGRVDVFTRWRLRSIIKNSSLISFRRGWHARHGKRRHGMPR